MRITIQLRWALITAAVYALATIPNVMAGGFYLSMEKPTGPDAMQARDAVLLVRPYGCHQPEEAVISATAEGFVNGRRQTIKLQLKTASKGIYAIQQQWPAEGTWLVAVRGSYLGAHTSALLELSPTGKVEIEKAGGKDPRIKILPRELTPADIDARLQLLASKRAPGSQSASR